MALINPNALPGTGFGTTGLISGLRFATGQDNLLGAREAIGQSLTRDYEQNILADLLSRGASTPEALASLSVNTPFANLGLSRLGSAIGAQRALAPQAIGQANAGDFGLLNRLNGFFGSPGNFNQQNYNPLSGLGLLGASGIGAQLSFNQAQPYQQALLQSLRPNNTSLPSANSAPNTFGSSFGDISSTGLYSDASRPATSAYRYP